MTTFQIKKEDSIKLRNIVTSEPFSAEERAIEYAIQYCLPCGIKCNVHYSDKKPEILKVRLQNKEADLNIAGLLEFYISTISIPQDQPA